MTIASIVRRRLLAGRPSFGLTCGAALLGMTIATVHAAAAVSGSGTVASAATADAQATPRKPAASGLTPHRSDKSRTPHAQAPAPASAPAAAAVRTSPADALPRLVAIQAPADDDDAIPRFALYAARDIETLGLQLTAQPEGANADTDVVVTLSLRDGATRRMRDFSHQHMNEPMTLIVDGVEMLTATIRSELGGRFALQMPKEKARLLFQRVLAKAGPAT